MSHSADSSASSYDPATASPQEVGERKVDQQRAEQPGSGSPGNGWTALVAATLDGTIGRDGDMPWKLRSDLQRFKRLTLGGVLVMGRKTYDSIGRPLPGRRNVVLSRTADSIEGVEVVPSIDALDTLLKMVETPVYLIGGATLYQQLLPRCDTLLLTRVWTQVPGDTHLPIDLSPFTCHLVSRLPVTPNDSNPTEFQIWQRR